MHLFLPFSPKVTCLLPHKKWHLLPVPLCRNAGGESWTHLQCGSARSGLSPGQETGHWLCGVWRFFSPFTVPLQSALLAAGEVSQGPCAGRGLPGPPPAWTSPSLMAAPGHCRAWCAQVTLQQEKATEQPGRSAGSGVLGAWHAALCSC